MADGVCRYCGQQKPLVKAHIIPEAFFRAIGVGKNAPLIFTGVPSHPHPKRAPIGVYDDGILCDACERLFDKVDAYGAKTLLHTLRGRALTSYRNPRQPQDVVGFEVKNIDQELLLNFLVATLWRASVSQHPFYARVRLGKRYEALGKEAVTGNRLSPAFGASLAGWLNARGENQALGLMDPFATRYGGVKVYQFYFGAIIAYIKADSQPFTEPMIRTALGTNSVLQLVRRDYQSSKEHAVLMHTARQQHQNSLNAKSEARRR